MKIKQIKNDKVNSFEFSYDLSKGDYLKKILNLYLIDKVFICIYGFDNNTIFENDLTEFQIKKFEKSLQCLILNISIDKLSTLFLKLNNNFDELVIWSPCIDWEKFTKEMKEPMPFLTLRKIKVKDNVGFYLSFKVSDFNNVEIISDLSFNNSRNIKKGDLTKILID